MLLSHNNMYILSSSLQHRFQVISSRSSSKTYSLAARSIRWLALLGSLFSQILKVKSSTSNNAISSSGLALSILFALLQLINLCHLSIHDFSSSLARNIFFRLLPPHKSISGNFFPVEFCGWNWFQNIRCVTKGKCNN